MYLQSESTYALATAATGFDGIVGDIAVNRFELVTGGELDRLSGLSIGQVYSLGAFAGEVSLGATYPVFKALAADMASLISANAGTEGTDAVLPFTVSVNPIADGVPQAGPDGKIAEGWLPDLPYLSAPSGIGFVVRLTSTITAVRSLTVDTTILVTNADGVAADPLLSRAALTGDVTAPAGSNVTTIEPNAVENTMLAQMPALTFKANDDTGAADPQDLTIPEVHNVLGVSLGRIIAAAHCVHLR